MLRSRPVVGTAVSGLRVRRCCSAKRVRGAAKRARLRRVRDSEVRYVEQVGGSLAYTVFGAGSCDVLLAQAWSPIDLMWDLPQLAAFLEALGAIARVIVFDGRNFGASDIIDEPGAASLEANADDFLAVLDAVSATRATVFDANTGVTGVTFAATYPQRVRSLIVSNLRSSYPEVRNMSAAQRRQRAKAWQGAEHLELSNPRLSHDPALRAWWGRARRLLAKPEIAAGLLEWAAHIDIAPLLPAVRAPTLVFHRRDDVRHDVATSRATAACIPNARFVELAGSESDIFLGNTAPALAEIERFLAQPEETVTPDRVLATILFTDIVASTDQLAVTGDDAWRRVLDEHDAHASRIVAEHRGTLIKLLGDGILATFDGPARAVRCAAALRETATSQGLSLRAGLHTGEIEQRSSDITGIAVVIAQRISATATANEILVSRTVVDLTAGSGLRFEQHGEHQLKGVPGTWPTFAEVSYNWTTRTDLPTGVGITTVTAEREIIE
jgi:class 3 adenylate cyclase